MKEKDVIVEFLKEQAKGPVSIGFLVLDIIAVFAVIFWVVDDIQEGMVFFAFMMVVLFGQYLIFRGIRHRLNDLEESRPDITISEIRKARLNIRMAMTVSRDGSETNFRMPPVYFDCIQVWFTNHPKAPLESAIARNMTASITITALDGTEVLHYYGQWAKSNAPDNVGYNDFLDSIDIPPALIPSKLLIARKYTDDSDCYAFTREALETDRLKGRSERYKIPAGCYNLSVHLYGTGVDKTFQYSFANFGRGKSIELTENNPTA